MVPPPFNKLFNSNEEFEQYLKEEFDSMGRYIESIKNLINLAHDVETSIGWNGPEGFCGVYIYRVPEGMEISEYSYTVTMPDGRRYILHEGD